jgi:hypothetical protein
MRAVRRASAFRFAKLLFSRMEWPGRGGMPPVTIRRGSPAVCTSRVVIRIHSGGGVHEFDIQGLGS